MVDKINTNINTDVFWNYKGSLRNFQAGGWAGVTFLEKWLLGYGKTWHTEVFEKRFHNDTSLWEGGYNLQSWNNVSLLHQWGKNFDTDFQRVRARVSLKPTQKLAVSNEFTYLTVSPDTNNRSTEIYLATADYNFTPDLWLRLIAQYSSRNDRLYVYSLFGWRFAPPFGALYIAWTADRFDDPLVLTSKENQRTLFVKFTIPVSL